MIEKKICLENEIYNEIKKFIHNNITLESEQIAIFIYEICYLRLLSNIVFKNIASNKNVSLEDFIIEYGKDISENIGKNNELEVSFDDTKYCLELAFEVLNDLEKYKYTFKSFFPVLSILCSYNGLIIRNIMEMDLFDGSKPEHQTPKQICELINNILNIGENDDVLDIGSAYGNYLIDTSKKKFKGLTGIETNNELSLISKIRLASLTANFQIIEDTVFNTLLDEKYDKIFCNYPLGIRYPKYEFNFIYEQMKNMKFYWKKIGNNSIEWLFVDALLTKLNENGRGAIIMNGGPLFKVCDEEYRKDLLCNQLIEAVIKLPNVTNFINTEQYLLVFSSNNEKVKFIDLSNQVERISFNKYNILMDNILEILNGVDSKYIITIDNASVIRNGSVLTVENYVGKKEIKYHNPKRISEFADDVFRGYQMTAQEQKELQSETGEYEVLMISNIEDGKISDSLVKINGNEKRHARYLLKENDMIISSKGTKIKIAVVNSIGNRKIIATGNLIVLRLDNDKINPYYLEMYLNSIDGQTILNQIQTGSVIISINPSRLIDVTISTIPIEKQNELAQKYKEKLEEIDLVKKKIVNLKQEQLNFYDNEIKFD